MKKFYFYFFFVATKKYVHSFNWHNDFYSFFLKNKIFWILSFLFQLFKKFIKTKEHDSSRRVKASERATNHTRNQQTRIILWILEHLFNWNDFFYSLFLKNKIFWILKFFFQLLKKFVEAKERATNNTENQQTRMGVKIFEHYSIE